MGITFAPVSGTDVLGTPALRLDPRHFHLMAKVKPFFDCLVDAQRLGDVVQAFNNGPNLPSEAYAIDEPGDDSEAILYASVAAFSMFAFRPENAIRLESDARGEVLGLRDAGAARLTESDVAITRSAVPGISWPGALVPAGSVIVPSGFVIRARIAEGVDPLAVAAVLNHPCWRVLTTAFAAGKAQFNLSQEQLELVPFPRMSETCATDVRSEYEHLMETITELLENLPDIRTRCDEILEKYLADWTVDGLQRPEIDRVDVAHGDVEDAPYYRLDNRWHGSPGRAIRSLLGGTTTVRLGTLLAEGPVKRSQPDLMRDEELGDATPYVVATLALQAGQVVKALGKPATADSVARLQLRSGDLLVAMDGVGSLGKAAVFSDDGEATVDSHVSVSRVIDPTMAPALACYLNSSYGRIQTETLMTGATGQTGMSVDELANLPIPSAVIEASSEIGEAFQEGAADYARSGDQVRRLVAKSSARVTEILVRHGALALGTEQSQYADAPNLTELLESLYPRVWR